MIQPASTDRIERLVRIKTQFLHFLERRLGTRADAEDLLQTAYLKLLDEANALRDDERLVPWFYQALRNLIVDHYRHRAAVTRAQERLTVEADMPSTPDEQLFRATCACVEGVIGTLQPAQAELLRRVELGEESLGQVAKRLGITPNNASVRLHRARRALRQALVTTCGVCAEHGCLDCTCRRTARP